MAKRAKGIYKRGNVWWMTYESEATQGRRIRQSLGTGDKREAETRYASIRADIERGQYNLNSPSKVKFKDLCQKFLNLHAVTKRSGWRDAYAIKKHLIPYFENKRKDFPVGHIDKEMIDEYKTMRVAKVKPATVNRELALLKTLFNKGIGWKMAKENPASRVELFTENNQIERILTDEEEVRLLDACVGRLSYLRPFIILALHTGMRQGELRSLKWATVSLGFGTIKIEAVNAKGKRVRLLPMNEQVRAVLTDLKKTAASDYVLLHSNGKPINRWTLRVQKINRTSQFRHR